MRDGQLRKKRADSDVYDGCMALPDAPEVVFFTVTRRQEWDQNNKPTGAWSFFPHALYPRNVFDGTPVDRVTLSLRTHLPLHDNRYALYFIRWSVPPSGGASSVQLHIAVVDDDASAAATARTFFQAHGLLLPKQRNDLMWYSTNAAGAITWHHPQKVMLQGKAVPLYVNLAIVNDVQMPQDGSLWTKGVPRRTNEGRFSR